MNYYEKLSNISKSVKQLSENDHTSLETKQSAIYFQQSIQECIEEVRQSVNRLNNLIVTSYERLQDTENCWLVKPSIASSTKLEIWNDVGNISGFSIRILKLMNELKKTTILQSTKLWNGRFEYLKNKHFIDSKGQLKKGIGWDEKFKFVEDIKVDIKKHCDNTTRLVEQQMQLIHIDIKQVNLETLLNCLSLRISLLNKQAQSDLIEQLKLIKSQRINKFENSIKHLPYKVLPLTESIDSDAKALVDKAWGDITWEEFCKFNDKFTITVENFITAIFEDRVKIVTEAIDRVLAFYNQFLQQQEKFQQETPEQREAEKFWIEQQFQELAQVQAGLETIKSAS